MARLKAPLAAPVYGSWVSSAFVPMAANSCPNWLVVLSSSSPASERGRRYAPTASAAVFDVTPAFCSAPAAPSGFATMPNSNSSDPSSAIASLRPPVCAATTAATPSSLSLSKTESRVV